MGDELVELRNIYNGLLDDIVILCKQYNCITPLDIYCLLYILSEKYVLEDKVVEELFSENEEYCYKLEDNDIKGINTFIYGGVCRHRSALLNDVFHRMGINSVVLYGKQEELFNFSFGNSLNKQLYDKLYVDEMLKKISEGARLESFKNHLKRRKIYYSPKRVNDSYCNGKTITPNHVIVMACDDERYYLDPLNFLTFYKDEGDIITHHNAFGDYFFYLESTQKILLTLINSGSYTDFQKKYNSIMEKPCSSEASNNLHIKKKCSFIKSNIKFIDEFLSKHSGEIQGIRNKCSGKTDVFTRSQ